MTKKLQKELEEEIWKAMDSVYGIKTRSKKQKELIETIIKSVSKVLKK